MYKTLNGLAPDSMPEMFERQADIHQYSTRSANVDGIFIPHRNISKGQEAISYAGARLWNEIPIEIIYLTCKISNKLNISYKSTYF